MKKRGKVSGSVEVDRQMTGGASSLPEAVTDGTIVKAGAAITQAMNFNSFRVEAGVEIPTTIFEIDATFKEAWDLVDRELARQQQMAEKVLEGL